MNCREFEQLWNEVLDARATGSSELERSLDAHALGCEPCRAVSARYQVLRQAVSVWTPPVASAESIERLYALTVPARPSLACRSRSSYWIPFASAAAVFLVAWLGGHGRPARDVPERTKPSTNIPIAANRPLRAALADATEVTIDLARQASAPAARIGRDVLDLDKVAAAEPVEVPEATSEPAPSTDVLHSVGQRVNAGVKPISGSARHAFSFLLGPPSGPAPDAQDTH